MQNKNKPLLLRPSGKDYLWGGSRLNDEFEKNIDLTPLAETWECSTHPDGPSYVVGGTFDGQELAEVLRAHPEYLGERHKGENTLPILIKFIDAKKDLSVQVHPTDAFAQEHENGQLGKTEMWYIMEAEEGARLVYGLKEGCTVEEFAKAVHEGRTEEMLNFVPVHKGEVYFIPSGQVHAIGAGILIAEIQQNSNITYRVYDYNRKGADGKPRQLHTEKALDVIKLRTTEEIDKIRFSKPDENDGGTALASCDYFTVKKYSVDGKVVVDAKVDSFLSVLVLDAENCKVGGYDAKRGDSFFIPAGSGSVEVTGKADVIVSKVN